MKRVLFVFSLAFLITSLWSPGTASAKSDTVRIKISGGRLTKAIEITDPRILALSNAWSGQFLDGTRSPENEPPKGLLAYEVSFFAELGENDVRKVYVLYYYPNAPEQGYIYLPGQGAVYRLNGGTILRYGRDGKWNYASPTWEALIRPALIRAETALTSASATQAAAPKDLGSSAPEAPEVSIDGWTKPQPGWLYVLDPRSESDHPGSRIWLLDPGSAKIMGSVRAGYDPDFALSPDGRHLYVASGERDSAELAVVDTASGKVLHIPFANRVLYRPWYDGLPPYSPIDVSSDSRSLRIPVPRIFSLGKIGYQLWTFDAESQGPLSARTHIEDCGDCRNWLISPLVWARSQDNSRVYMGYGPSAPNGMARSTGLRVFDTTTQRQLGRIQTSIPFWSIAIGKDGKVIYALAPEQHRVLVIDTATLQERRTIDVGRTPSMALVAP